MTPIEWEAVSPEEMIREIEEYVQRSHENKYAFQVGLKDVDFDVDEEKLKLLRLALPFRNIDQNAHRQAANRNRLASNVTFERLSHLTDSDKPTAELS